MISWHALERFLERGMGVAVVNEQLQIPRYMLEEQYFNYCQIIQSNINKSVLLCKGGLKLSNDRENEHYVYKNLVFIFGGKGVLKSVITTQISETQGGKYIHCISELRDSLSPLRRDKLKMEGQIELLVQIDSSHTKIAELEKAINLIKHKIIAYEAAIKILAHAYVQGINMASGRNIANIFRYEYTKSEYDEIYRGINVNFIVSYLSEIRI